MVEGLKNKRIATLTLGCKVNQYETDAMKERLEQAGGCLVSFQETADIYIVNTCTVTNMAERKSRQMLHRAKKNNPHAVVAAVGCYVQTASQQLLEDLSVDLVIGNNRKKDIVEILTQYLEKGTNQAWIPIGETDEYEELKISHTTEHTRAYIKIQDGCNQFCSYCLIPYARGRIRSRKPEDVMEEVKRLAEQGCKEVVLTGIHLSSYGKEWDHAPIDETPDGTALLRLLRQIHTVEGIVRIRLGSLEPRIITEAFVTELQTLEKVCPHFHLSLQSACNDTLKRMNRKYTIEEYVRSCALLRKAYEHPAITTDVIVGFPGETREEFETTVQNLENLHLYEIHVFQYSKRKGTAAERMPDQIPEPEKRKRSERLLALTAKQKQEYEAYYIGKPLEVLVEEAETGKENCYSGHTERYIKVEVESERDIRNQLVTVRFLGNPKEV